MIFSLLHTFLAYFLVFISPKRKIDVAKIGDFFLQRDAQNSHLHTLLKCAKLILSKYILILHVPTAEKCVHYRHVDFPPGIIT